MHRETQEQQEGAANPLWRREWEEQRRLSEGDVS